jgi:hypothetical protein
MNLNEIIKKARKENDLFSNVDIEKLLDAVDNEKNDYLENKTIQDIIDEIVNTLKLLPIDKYKIEDLCNKLSEYRYIDKICDLHKGKHVRWIRTNPIGKPLDYNLTNGGVVTDITFTREHTLITCRNYQNKFIKYKFDDCITFQKLSSDEQMILMAYEYAQKK